jgi:sugar O-acyltransferase (sialic acid O-acetyltransferase NeuD family)
MEKIIIVGSSGHAKVVADIVECEGRYAIAGLLDRFRQPGERAFGYPILGREEDLPRLIGRFALHGGLIAVGDNFIRATIASNVRELCPELYFVNAIHPSATVAKNVRVGAGTVVMAGAVLNPGAGVGQFCILNTKSSLDHDSVMEDFASLAPGATTGGNCRIGHGAAIGIGATLIHGIHVGEHTVVGAGATVITSLEERCLAYGTPATMIRKRNSGDQYL